jgi:2-amino-4-hydroxy-6-hydroxymethyldihydropteridine diphosphokinase
VIYIGIGANLGDREKTLQEATDILNTNPEIAVIAASAVYETAPIGVVDQPYFLNAVLQVYTSLSARSLLNCLLAIERKFGRLRETRWGPRTLDLDILLYGDAVINQPGLQVPHPHLHERAFVLAPLCDLKPDLKHPVLGQSIQFLTESLNKGTSAHALGMDLPVRKIEGLNLIKKK